MAATGLADWRSREHLDRQCEGLGGLRAGRGGQAGQRPSFRPHGNATFQGPVTVQAAALSRNFCLAMSPVIEGGHDARVTLSLKPVGELVPPEPFMASSAVYSPSELV